MMSKFLSNVNGVIFTGSIIFKVQVISSGQISYPTKNLQSPTSTVHSRISCSVSKTFPT